MAYLKDQSYTLESGSAAFSLLSACNGVAIIISGFLSDKMSKYYLLSIIFIGRGMTLLILAYIVSIPEPHYKSWSIWLFSVFFGIFDYSVIPPTVGLCEEHFPKLVGIAMGILLLLHSLGAALGSGLSGRIYDEYGTYKNVIIILSFTCFIAGGSLLYVPMRYNNDNDNDNDVDVSDYDGDSVVKDVAGAGAGAKADLKCEYTALSIDGNSM